MHRSIEYCPLVFSRHFVRSQKRAYKTCIYELTSPRPIESLDLSRQLSRLPTFSLLVFITIPYLTVAQGAATHFMYMANSFNNSPPRPNATISRIKQYPSNGDTKSFRPLSLSAWPQIIPRCRYPGEGPRSRQYPTAASTTTIMPPF